VIGKTHRRFWKHFDVLPLPIQKLAREKYALWKRDPRHASLRFESDATASARSALASDYRALGLRESDVIAWFWFGTHEEYNRFRF